VERLLYLDFELKLERDGPNYVARVLTSPVGEAANSFTLPFSEEKLENLVLKMGHMRGRTRSAFSDETDAAEELGGKLFEAVFGGDVRACFRNSLDEAKQQEGTGLRLKLRLQDVAELADLPWEFLFDTSLHRFLAQSNQTPLVRFIEMPERIRPLMADMPLRILVMISSPDDPDLAPLDVELEKSILQKALDPLIKDGKVQVEWLDEATLPALRRALKGGPYHIFHYIGHGGFDRKSQEGVLVLEDSRGRAFRAEVQQIGPILYDHPSLRLAVLNSCEGARNSRSDAFAGVAASLIRQGIPAVIAMQFEITDDAAITFAGDFYSSLAEGFPVDAAVAEARKAILVQPNDIEWGTPVLYMRAPDGVLFELAKAPISPSTAPTPEPAAAPAPLPAVETLERPAVEEIVEPPPARRPASITMEISRGRPGRLGSRLSPLHYDLTLHNLGDEAAELQLNANDRDGRCAFALPSEVLVAARSATTARLTVLPRRRRWRGRRETVPFVVFASGGGDEPPITAPGEFDDLPYGWLPYAGGGALAIVVGGFLLLPGGDGDKSLTAIATPTATSMATSTATSSATDTPTPPPAPTDTPVPPIAIVTRPPDPIAPTATPIPPPPTPTLPALQTANSVSLKLTGYGQGSTIRLGDTVEACYTSSPTNQVITLWVYIPGAGVGRQYSISGTSGCVNVLMEGPAGPWTFDLMRVRPLPSESAKVSVYVQ